LPRHCRTRLCAARHEPPPVQNGSIATLARHLPPLGHELEPAEMPTVKAAILAELPGLLIVDGVEFPATLPITGRCIIDTGARR